MELWSEDLAPGVWEKLELERLMDELLQLKETDPCYEEIQNQISEIREQLEAYSQK